MNKSPKFLMVLLATLCSCGHKSPTTTADKNSNDSIYQLSHIYQICTSDPERALALADTAEMLNLLRPKHTNLNILKSAIYFNGFKRPRLAYHYALQAYEDNKLHNGDTIAYVTNLTNLVSMCQDLSDFQGAIKYATEAIDFIHKDGRFKGEEGKQVMHIGMSQHALGMDKEAKTNMKRGIALGQKIVDIYPCWSNVQNLLFTYCETMNELGEMGDWQEAADMIPQLLKVNSLHETLESEAPEGVIDMYRYFTFAQCMEIYQHLDNRKLADEYYQKSITTDYAKTPEGLCNIIPYQLWTKDYGLVLKNIEVAKPAFQEKGKTVSDSYVNKLLVEEVDALTGLGRYKEAADASREIIALKDTLFKHKQESEAQELAVIYESGEKDKLIQKSLDEKRDFERTKLLSIISALVLSILALAYIVRISVRAKKQITIEKDVAIRAQKEEQKQKEIALKALSDAEEARKQAERADSLKSLFLQNMSHEIRTPLNAIVGFSETLTSPEIAEVMEAKQRKEMSHLIQVNTKLLLTLVNDTLDISKLESGTYKVSLSDVDVKDLCQDSLQSVTGSEQKGVNLELRLPQKTVVFRTDRERVQQVLVNFLTNACKNTTSGKITLGYEVVKLSGALYLRFFVEDTGCGIPKDKIDTIFKRFEKIDSFKQGIGLGLSICQLICKMLNGNIYVDSSYTKGARFVFEHPLPNEMMI